MLFICKSTKPRAVAPATSSIRLSHSGPLFLCTDTSGLGTIWPGTAPRAQSPLKSFKLASPKPVSLVCLPSYGNHKIVLPIPTLLPPLEQVPGSPEWSPPTPCGVACPASWICECDYLFNSSCLQICLLFWVIINLHFETLPLLKKNPDEINVWKDLNV